MHIFFRSTTVFNDTFRSPTLLDSPYVVLDGLGILIDDSFLFRNPSAKGAFSSRIATSMSRI